MFGKIPWLSIGRFALILVCLAAVLALVIIVLPIYLDISAFKGPVEEVLSSAAGAPVTVDEIRLHPSLWPTLRLSGLEVNGSGGEPFAPLARIDSAEVKVALLPLLNQELHLKRLVLSGGHIRLEGNRETSDDRSESMTSVWTIGELADIELTNVTLVLASVLGDKTNVTISSLNGDIAADRPLTLDLDGSLDGIPLAISASGPTAAALSRAADFPVAAELTLSDLKLSLEGEASREPEATRFRGSFEMLSDDLDVVRRLGFVDLPRMGGLRMSGQLSTHNVVLELSDLEGAIGSTSFYADAALDLAPDQREIVGRLSLGRLDLGPWLEAANESPADTSAPLPFELLSAAKADLKLRIQELSGLAVELSDLELAVEVTDGVLTVPAALNAAGIPLSADLEVQVDRDLPDLSSRLRIPDVNLDQLDSFFDVPESLDGRIGGLELNISSSGDSLDALRTNLVVEVLARETFLSFAGVTDGAAVEAHLGRLQTEHRSGQPLIATAEGRFLEETFLLDLQTGSLADLIENDRWPVSLRLQGAGANLDVAGTVARATDGLDLDLEFNLSGDRLGDLRRWLNLPPELDIPYGLDGRLAAAAGARLLRLYASSIGNSRFSAELVWSPGKEPLRVDLHAESVDLRQLQDLVASVTALDTEDEVINIDIPLLPSKRSFVDAEIELTIDRLLRKTVDLTDVSATLRFQEGRLDRSPFWFSYANQNFDGSLSLDLREEIPRFALEVHGSGDELGGILEQEGYIDDFTVAAERLDLRIDSVGASIREILRSADLSGQLVNVRWKVQPPELDQPVRVKLDRVDLSGPRGKPIVLTAAGTLAQEPLNLRLTLPYPEDPQVAKDQDLPFNLAVELAATEIALAGEVELPIQMREFDMAMTVEGESLMTLSPLFDTDLPGLGPYRLQGRLSVLEEGLSLKDLNLVVGESDLHGEINYRRIDDRPTIAADLSSELIRTEDALPPDRDPNEKEEQALGGAKPSIQSAPEITASMLEKLDGLDVTLDLEVRQLQTLGGPVDNLTVDADLAHGELNLILSRPQGDAEDAKFLARIRHRPQGLQANLLARWDRQPYGLLADLLGADYAEGSWGVDLDLESRGSTVEELAANLSGHLYYVDYPDELSASVLDFWGGGLINSLLPVFNLGTESRVNCAVAKLQAERGVLTPERLIVDSTRSRVRGKGFIDLRANHIDLRLKPRPKQRSLINLSTPVMIRGPLTDPSVQIARGGLAVTFFRLSLWVYTVWRDIARQPLPPDGHDVCDSPFAEPQKK